MNNAVSDTIKQQSLQNRIETCFQGATIQTQTFCHKTLETLAISTPPFFLSVLFKKWILYRYKTRSIAPHFLHIQSSKKSILTPFNNPRTHTLNDFIYLIIPNTPHEQTLVFLIYYMPPHPSLSTQHPCLKSTLSFLNQNPIALKKNQFTPTLFTSKSSTIIQTITPYLSQMPTAEEKALVYDLHKKLHACIAYEACFVYLETLKTPTLYLFHVTSLSDQQTNQLKTATYASIQLLFESFDLHTLTIDRVPFNTTHPTDSLTPTLNVEQSIPIIYENELKGMVGLFRFSTTPFTEADTLRLENDTSTLICGLRQIIKHTLLHSEALQTYIDKKEDCIFVYHPATDNVYYNKQSYDRFFIKKNTLNSTASWESFLAHFGLLSLYKNALETKKNNVGKSVIINSFRYVLDIIPFITVPATTTNILILLTDITTIKEQNKRGSRQFQSLSRMTALGCKKKSLESLSESILSIFLNDTLCNYGSVQLYKDQRLYTVAHHNFSDKLRNTYHYENGNIISDVSLKKKTLISIPHYFKQKHTNPDTPFLTRLYISIPLLAHQQRIGLINLVQTFDTEDAIIDTDHLLSLSDIASTYLKASIDILQEQKEQKETEKESFSLQLQQNIINSPLPKINGLDFGTLLKTHTTISGDFYYTCRLSSSKVGIIVADFVGRDINLGTYMAVFKSMLTRTLTATLSPQKILHLLNHMIINDPIIGCYVAVFYGIIDLKAKHFSYTNAGLPHACYLHNQTLTQLDTPCIPIGVCAAETYKQQDIALQDNSWLFIFTQGMYTLKDKHKCAITPAYIQKIIRANPQHPAQSILNKIHAISQISTKKQSDAAGILVHFNSHHIKKASLLHTKSILLAAHTNQSKPLRATIWQLGTQASYSNRMILECQIAHNELFHYLIQSPYKEAHHKTIAFSFKLYSNRMETTIKILYSSRTIELVKKTQLGLFSIQSESEFGIHLLHTLIDHISYTTAFPNAHLKLTKYVVN